ncbi:MAG: hypothetical protein M1522_02195, partial [Actinobacteria bacterium]|nr:hypothetical protein [Actinomycetota bacterium]
MQGISAPKHTSPSFQKIAWARITHPQPQSPDQENFEWVPIPDRHHTSLQGFPRIEVRGLQRQRASSCKEHL